VPEDGTAGPSRSGDLTDVAGLRVGHAQRIGDGWLSGVTVVLCPPGGCVAGVDVRGGGPGTRETDALDPRNLVPRIDAVTLTGGSAYGLAAADGVMRWLEEHGQGFPVGAGPAGVVPIVPAAALFDLGRGGDFAARPGAELGYEAARAAARSGDRAAVEQGVVGAGTGAVAGGLKGGAGTASTRVGDTTVAALAVVNAYGSVLNARTGELHAAPYCRPGDLDPPPGGPACEPIEQAPAEPDPDRPARSLNTTLAVVATDARIDRAEAHKLAGVAHDGLARAIHPVHTLFDGDTVFALATGATGGPAEAAARPGWLTALHTAAADTLSRAVVRAVVSARCTRTARGPVPCYRHRPA
jgi:putative pantetheine hydrolase